MVSHDMPSAIKYSNKILLVNQTQKFFGKTEDYIGSNARKEFDGELVALGNDRKEKDNGIN